MKNYHTVAFDLDGTLTDPKKGLTSAFEYALKKHNIDFGTKDSLTKFIGPPLKESFKEEYSLSDEEAASALFLFREFFGVYGWWDNELYCGIKELLSDLKKAGKRIVLATSKPDVYSSRILELFGIAEYFDFSEGASFDSSRERKCDVLDYALSWVGVVSDEDKRGAILVGDTKYDIEGARICGVDSIGVLYGYGSLADFEREGATYVAATVEDVRKILGV